MGIGATGRTGRLAGAVSLASLLALAGCGGGGGGGASINPGNTGTSTSGSTSTGSTSTGSTGSTSTGTAAVSIGPFGITPSTATPLTATAGGPSFATSVPNGTAFPLTEAVLTVTNTSVTDNTAASSPATLTLVGVETSTGLVTTGPTLGTFAYRLNVPGLPLGTDANAVLPHDGTVVMLTNGAQASLKTSTLNYTQLGVWVYAPSSSTASFGTLTSGFQTPTSGVPTSGTGVYTGGGSAAGTVYAPDGAGGVLIGALSGTANVSVNFSSSAVSGSMTGMTATASAGSGGAVSNWNTVNLTGTLSGATVNGTTSTTGATGTFGLSAAATGKFTGALYGPNGQELGAIWSLNDAGGATNGKAAIGIIGATKQ